MEFLIGIRWQRGYFGGADDTRYKVARVWLLISLIVTAVNFVLFFCGIDFRLGLIAYFLSWFCSKDNGRWMTVAAALFFLDMLFLIAEWVLFSFVLFEMNVVYLIDLCSVIFHGWVVYDTIHARIIWHRTYVAPKPAPATTGGFWDQLSRQ